MLKTARIIQLLELNLQIYPKEKEQEKEAKMRKTYIKKRKSLLYPNEVNQK